ncbi:MAG: 23S rRNA (uracil(1939)-C(5))-methyltransferase RlmD [Candidatus Omnitrophota bacterium]
MKIKIEKIIYPGKSLARQNGKIIFSDQGLPGEELDVEIIKERKDYLEVLANKVLTPSSHRIKPNCGHYKICSTYQYIEYSQQILIKQQQLDEIFMRTLKDNKPLSIPIHACENPWHYRNKIHLHIIREKCSSYYAYHQSKSHNKFIQIDNCFLGSEQINQLLEKTLEIINQNKICHLEEIIVRENRGKDQLLLSVMGYSDSKKAFKSLKALCVLKNTFPVRGITYINRKSRLENIVFGKNHIEDTIDLKKFSYGTDSFFQINQKMLDHLIADLKKTIPFDKKKSLADLYCGVGLFAIIFSDFVKDVLAVDSSAASSYFLKKNIRDNQISNIQTNQCDCEKWISCLGQNKTDILIIDPPRRGLTEIIINQLIKTPLEFIAYISCDPVTLARDLKKLLNTYTIIHASAYDFFPQTGHIETLVVLEKARGFKL